MIGGTFEDRIRLINFHFLPPFIQKKFYFVTNKNPILFAFCVAGSTTGQSSVGVGRQATTTTCMKSKKVTKSEKRKIKIIAST